MTNKKTVYEKNLVPGSKIPIKYLLDYIKHGYTISDFVSSYPWIKKQNVEKAIEEIKSRDFTAHNAL
jgi:uncharacterized protein (DUF433 family)